MVNKNGQEIIQLRICESLNESGKIGIFMEKKRFEKLEINFVFKLEL